MGCDDPQLLRRVRELATCLASRYFSFLFCSCVFNVFSASCLKRNDRYCLRLVIKFEFNWIIPAKVEIHIVFSLPLTPGTYTLRATANGQEAFATFVAPDCSLT
jgi:hypothetical protein